MVQDRAILTIADQSQVAYDLWSGTIFTRDLRSFEIRVKFESDVSI